MGTPIVKLRDHIDEISEANADFNAEYGARANPVRLVCPVCNEPKNKVTMTDAWLALPDCSLNIDIPTGKVRIDQEDDPCPTRKVTVGMLCECGHKFDFHIDMWTDKTTCIGASVHNEAFEAYAEAIGKPLAKPGEGELADYD